MTRSRFSPQDPAAIHERFERIKARAIRSAELQLRTVLRTEPAPMAADEAGTRVDGSRRRRRRRAEDDGDDEEEGD
jgi:hypothetical protein